MYLNLSHGLDGEIVWVDPDGKIELDWVMEYFWDNFWRSLYHFGPWLECLFCMKPTRNRFSNFLSRVNFLHLVVGIVSHSEKVEIVSLGQPGSKNRRRISIFV